MIPYRRPTTPAPGITHGPPKEWEPGMPLYERSAHTNSCYLYNFRYDETSENCFCGDAADWPSQERRMIYPVGGDELGDFIAACKAERGDVA